MPIRTNETMIVNGRLKQVGLSFRSSKKRRSAVFLCNCGNRNVILLESVSEGKTTSCGCLKSESSSARLIKHGNAKRGQASPAWATWQAMRRRCADPNSNRWDMYGGRGITVCERWRESFEAFLEDMGPRPDGCSIDRIDNNKGYSKENCRWASVSEQARNRKSSVLIEFNGKTQCITEWSEEVGIGFATLYQRLKKGWSVEKALTHPVRVRRKEIPCDE